MEGYTKGYSVEMAYEMDEFNEYGQSTSLKEQLPHPSFQPIEMADN